MNTPKRDNNSDRETDAGTHGSDRHGHLPTGMVTAADLMAGAVIPVRLSLNVTLRPGSREGRGRAGTASAPRLRRGPSVDTRLVQHAPRITEWARRNAENAALLFSDPLSAVAKAGVELSETDRDLLKRRVEALIPRDVLPAGVKLAGLKVTVVGEEYAQRKEHGAPKAVALRHATPKPRERKRSKGGGGRE